MSAKREEGKLSVDRLLQYIISVKFPEYIRIRLSRSQLLRLLKEYLRSIKSKQDPILVFEAWERVLRQPRLVGDRLVKLNPYNSELTIEFTPMWGFMQRAAEVRKSSLVSELCTKIRDLS